MGLRVLFLACLVLSAVSAWSQTYYRDLRDFGGLAKNANGKIGLDGAYPEGKLAFDSAGNLYGTAYVGGAHDAGSVWELTTTGIYKDLHDFGGKITNANGATGLDGENPTAGVTLDSKGNIYGTTFSGGPNSSAGMVWEITAGGTYLDLHDFGGGTTNANGSGGPDGVGPYAGVTIDSAGNLYGTTYGGGPNYYYSLGDGMVWEITSAAVYKDLHDFGGNVTNSNGKVGPDGLRPYAGVAIDSKGDLYGDTFFGGPNNPQGWSSGMLWQITPAGAYNDLHDFGATIKNVSGSSGPDGSFPTGSVAVDVTGDVFGTTEEGGPFQNAGILWELNAAGVYVDLHDFGGTITNANGKSGPDGVGPLNGVTLDASGDLFGTVLGGGPNVLNGDTAGIVWEVTPWAAYVDLHDFGGSITNASELGGADGENPACDLILDKFGNLYGTALFGGPNNGEGAGGCGNLWTVTPSALSPIVLDPSSVPGGTSSKATVTLAAPAPAGGVSVALSSNSTDAAIPATLAFAMGQTTLTFEIKTTPVAKSVVASIVAKSLYGTETAKLTVGAPRVSAVILTPSELVGSSKSTATVELNGPAPTGGIVLTLSSSAASATVPATVSVAAGKTSTTFSISTSPVAAKAVDTIRATYGSSSLGANLTIYPPQVYTFAMAPGGLAGGNTSTGTVTLTSVAPTGGVVVKLSSNSADAKVPASVTVIAGAKSVTFVATTAAVTKQTLVILSASDGTVTKTTGLTINPPILSSLNLSPTSVTRGSSSVATIKLNGLAPAGGVKIALLSGSASATVPASVTIEAGASSATFSVGTSKTGKAASVVIQATYAGVTKSTTLTIRS